MDGTTACASAVASAAPASSDRTPAWSRNSPTSHCSSSPAATSAAHSTPPAATRHSLRRWMASLTVWRPSSERGRPQVSTDPGACRRVASLGLRFHTGGCHCVAGGAPYWKDYGVHAASNLISAGVPTAAELPQIAANVFNDSTTICSWSPFNTFCEAYA